MYEDYWKLVKRLISALNPLSPGEPWESEFKQASRGNSKQLVSCVYICVSVDVCTCGAFSKCVCVYVCMFLRVGKRSRICGEGVD